MEARLSQAIPSFLTKGISESARDRIVVVGDPPSGALVYRPAVWVHELEVGKDMVSRLRASSLIDFALRHDGSRSALFLVEPANTKMQRFIEKFGAVRQTDRGDLLYTLTI